jgi:hypothetical protein
MERYVKKFKEAAMGNNSIGSHATNVGNQFTFTYDGGKSSLTGMPAEIALNHQTYFSEEKDKNQAEKDMKIIQKEIFHIVDKFDKDVIAIFKKHGYEIYKK